MFHILFAILFFLANVIFAAPLESGYALAPMPSASQAEKVQAYTQIRQRVIEASRRYEGVPYVYGGMTSRGLDCSGFICLSFRDALGVSLPRSASGLYSWAEQIPVEKAQPGDLIFFRTDNTRNITHVGLYLGDKRFIHSASAGARTGVIYSSLNEQYWARAFAGAGRAFPEGASSQADGSTSNTDGIRSGNSGSQGNQSNSGRNSQNWQINSGNEGNQAGTASNKGLFGNTRLMATAVLAPSIDVLQVNGSIIRSFSSQIGFYSELHRQFGLGLELRPEYDFALGVFRLPLTLSIGITEKFTLFAGPALSFGNAEMTIKGNKRNYYGGTSWFGAAGFAFTPSSVKVSDSELSPYIEAAWQSFSNNKNFHIFADTFACFRVLLGIRWRKQVR